MKNIYLSSSTMKFLLLVLSHTILFSMGVKLYRFLLQLQRNKKEVIKISFTLKRSCDCVLTVWSRQCVRLSSRNLCEIQIIIYRFLLLRLEGTFK